MSFFNNGFMSALGKLADMFLISVLWLLCCLPVITIIPSTIAMYYVTVKVVRRDAGYVFQDFFRGFSQNWKQGVLLELIYFVIGVLLYLAYHFSQAAGLTSIIGKCYYAFCLMMILFIACVTAYLLPVISRFRLSLFSAFRLALSFSFGNLVTLIPLLLTLAAGVAAVYIFPPAILILPPAYCFLLSYSVEKVLIRYIRNNLEHPEEHIGMWYMEE